MKHQINNISVLHNCFCCSVYKCKTPWEQKFCYSKKHDRWTRARRILFFSTKPFTFLLSRTSVKLILSLKNEYFIKFQRVIQLLGRLLKLQRNHIPLKNTWTKKLFYPFWGVPSLTLKSSLRVGRALFDFKSIQKLQASLGEGPI